MSGRTLGQIGYEALQDSRHPVNRTAWTHPAVADSRPAWETAMQAVAAHLGALECTPLAATAETIRLRELVAEILADFWPDERFEGISEGLRDSQARVDDYRKRAGLDPQ